uniref:Large ribosomal subunit protein uL4m n=1 Tax=Crassostrea virginica TaxID=6565 RepID=A0A8B8E2I6_CRAVI|nr:39S ribosomal protein L4, mitochondrial-like [Crassostrea virginica]XP_022334125.1 39S ribosomal protein L4, mitochondrial-like [Crassostrea virginica]
MLGQTCRRINKCLNACPRIEFKRNLWRSSLCQQKIDITLKYTDEANASKDNREPTLYEKFLQNPKSVPLITSRKMEYPNKYRPPRQAWLETLSTAEDHKLGMLDLHPDVFAVHPRLDILYHNLRWQEFYKKIDYNWTPSRGDLDVTHRKQMPQKRSGRARNRNRSSVMFRTGAKPLGPRGPRALFYMLPKHYRVQGLCTALSFKYAQNNLHIVDSLEIPTDDPEYIQDLVDTRFWGFSALFVDDTDYMPENITYALADYPHYNLLPVYGLNVRDMLKHETLILTLAALERIEQRLLYHSNRSRSSSKFSMESRYDQY